MKVVSKIAAGFGLFAACVGIAVVVIQSKAEARITRSWQVEPAEIPVPWPLSDDELARLRAERASTAGAQSEPVAESVTPSAIEASGRTEASPVATAPEVAPDLLAGVDLTSLAQERAVARGKLLAHSFLGCVDCHDHDFGGKVIMDNFPMGRWVAPNITSAGLTKDFSSKDWVRILRHGVNHRGHSATMPAIDYTNLSDREISDVIAFVRAQPPVSRELPHDKLGPIRALLVWNGTIPLSAELIDHQRPRPALPPAAEASPTYGAHLAQVCVGCHRTDYSGGPIRGGDPAWPPAPNLTPDESGLKGWTRENFFSAMREGKRPDGSAIRAPMPWQAMAGMEDVHLDAMYQYFMSLPPLPMGS